MKLFSKTLLLAAALAAGFSTLSLRADDATPPPAGPRMHHRMPTPAERVAHMTKMLGLSDAQQQQILVILQDQQTAAKAIWTNASLDRDQRRSAMKDLWTSSRQKIHAVLTPEQVAKFKSIMEQHRGHKGPM